MKCPKCGYERKKQDDELTPKTDCPYCGIIYAKFRPQLNKNENHHPIKGESQEIKNSSNVAEEEKVGFSYKYAGIAAALLILCAFIYAGSSSDNKNQGGKHTTKKTPLIKKENLSVKVTSNTVLYNGKMWQQTDDGEIRNWQEAKEYCNDLVLSGYSDWSLPSKKELKSIVLCSNGTPTPTKDYPEEPCWCGGNFKGGDVPFSTPTIDPIFGFSSNAVSYSSFWTADERKGDSEEAWYVNFQEGANLWWEKDEAAMKGIFVRCIRTDIESIRNLAEKGDPEYQHQLANLFFEEDKEKFTKWTRKAAEQGHAISLHNLGLIYQEGLGGVIKNPQEATKWYRKAALQGNVGSQFTLAWRYYEKNDLQKAARWFKSAAEQGHAEAQLQLSMCYIHGEGVSQNSQQAAWWLMKAAKQGNAEAEYYLSRWYEDGIGVVKDMELAKYWLGKAVEHGYLFGSD